MRITIDRDQFVLLLSGLAVRQETLTGEMVDIVLEGMDYSTILRSIEKANRSWVPAKEEM